MKMIGFFFVTIPRSVFGSIEKVTSGIPGIIECILVNAYI
jgi:hypothetical protein